MYLLRGIPRTDPKQVSRSFAPTATHPDFFTELRLSHFSVQDYLTSTQIGSGSSASFKLEKRLADNFIANTCLIYLSQFDKEECLTKSTFGLFPLTLYAAQYWVYHACSSGKDIPTSLQEPVLQFFQSDNVFYNWVRIFDIDRWNHLQPRVETNLDRSLSSIAPALYYAAASGMTTICQRLLESGVNVNERGG